MQILGIIPARYLSSRLQRKYLVAAVFSILFCFDCLSMTSGFKVLDLGAFSIKVPKEWEKSIPHDQEGSFVGEIIGPQVKLSFDCSSHGYANHLLQTEDEYIKQGDWKMSIGCPFCKPGITYTANFNVKNEKLRQMKEKGITDSTLVKVEADPSYETKEYIHKPTAEQQTKFPKADYVAELTYRDSTVIKPIIIPQEVKTHNIVIDTTQDYIIKTIWPKTQGKGMTGIYIHSKSTSFNFQMNGENLSLEDQELALQAFKTIKFSSK